MISQSLSSKDCVRRNCAYSQLDLITSTTCTSDDFRDEDQSQEQNDQIKSAKKFPGWFSFHRRALGIHPNKVKVVFPEKEGRMSCCVQNMTDDRDECVALRKEKEAQSSEILKRWFRVGANSSVLEQREDYVVIESDSDSIQSESSNIISEQNVATTDSEEREPLTGLHIGETMTGLAIDLNGMGFNNARLSNINDDRPTVFETARKAGVAVAGGAMVGIGVVMIPLPTPFGFVVAGAGMAVLGTEFPAAQKALDSTRDALVHALEKHCDESSWNAKSSESKSADEAVGDSVKRTLKGAGNRALPLIKAIGTQTRKSA